MSKYRPPAARTIRKYLKDNSLTGEAAAALVNVNPRTFRRYISHTSTTPIPYAVWYTLRAKSGGDPS